MEPANKKKQLEIQEAIGDSVRLIHEYLDKKRHVGMAAKEVDRVCVILEKTFYPLLNLQQESNDA